MRRHPISSLNLFFFIIITELELLPVLVPSKEAVVVWVILEELPKPQPLMELTDQDSLLLPALTLAPMIRHNNNNKHPSATGRKKTILTPLILFGKVSWLRATNVPQHNYSSISDDEWMMTEKMIWMKKFTITRNWKECLFEKLWIFF